MNNYKCKHCGGIFKRNSNKKWIKSYCENSGKNVHLIKLSKQIKIKKIINF